MTPISMENLIYTTGATGVDSIDEVIWRDAENDRSVRILNAQRELAQNPAKSNRPGLKISRAPLPVRPPIEPKAEKKHKGLFSRFKGWYQKKVAEDRAEYMSQILGPRGKCLYCRDCGTKHEECTVTGTRH